MAQSHGIQLLCSYKLMGCGRNYILMLVICFLTWTQTSWKQRKSKAHPILLDKCASRNIAIWLFLYIAVCLLDDEQQGVEDVGHGFVLFRGRLQKRGFPQIGEPLAFLRAYHSFHMQICFVADQHNWNAAIDTNNRAVIKQTLTILDFPSHIKQFVVNDLNDLERFRRSYGIDKYVAMNVHRISGRENWVFIVAGRVYELYFVILAMDANRFGES